MIRHATVFLIFAVLAAFAGAQGERPALTASQQQQLFQKNRGMIQTLVDSSLKISQSGDYIERSRSYRKVVMQFQKELDQAAGDTDASRIAELGKHLDTVLRQGLAPSLREANRSIPAGGTGRDDLIDIRDKTVADVSWLQNIARNKWADTPEVRAVIDALETAKKEVGAAVPPER
jgi:hypothetical protein